ncbi:MAG: hypothetical protein V7K67_06495, partial [Nostoc sp.]|uniref:hypothetical protein n=1 Tax=Nostoc sp. TaxID=1180 RepID=UPI002FF74C71
HQFGGGIRHRPDILPIAAIRGRRGAAVGNSSNHCSETASACFFNILGAKVIYVHLHAELVLDVRHFQKLILRCSKSLVGTIHELSLRHFRRCLL